MWTRNIIREINYYNESLIYYMIQHAMILYGDNDTATARAIISGKNNGIAKSVEGWLGK
jgi:hypothetical protein